MITENDLLNLKRIAEDKRKTFIQAEATLAEVNRNIETHRKELIECGVDPDNRHEILKQKEEEIQNKYNEILAKLSSDGQQTLV